MNYFKAEKSLNYDRSGVDSFRYEAGTIAVDESGYFDFMLFMQRIAQNNYFVTRIKDNKLDQSIIKKVLTEKHSDTIIKDEIILFTGLAAQKAGLRGIKLLRTVVLTTNQLDRNTNTISELHKRRWNI